MELHYTIIYSAKRKTLGITVERDCSVVVRAPVGTSPATIEQVVNRKRQWLYEKINLPLKYHDLPHPPGKELVNGESLLYLGRLYHLELVDDGEEIRLDEKIYFPKKLAAQKREAFQNWYKQQAKAQILPRVPDYAHRLGVTYNQAKIMSSKYQWGSCTPNDNLNFNWRLIKAPFFVIDYIIIHELAHLLEANHTPRFWNIIRAQITQLDKAKTWLKNNGALLEQDI